MQTKTAWSDKHITYRQAQEIYGISRTTMWRILRDPNSGVRAARIGKLQRIEVDSLERYLARKLR